MPLVRFRHEGRPTLGVLRHATTPEVTALPLSLAALLALPLADAQAAVEQATGPALPFTSADALPPVDEQEVWAAGVTYRRSRDAGSKSRATRPSTTTSTLRPGRRSSSRRARPGSSRTASRSASAPIPGWDVPEAEIGLVINAAGEIVGYLAGNDMSSRSIEGENALYLPQAKVYEASCALSALIARCGRRRHCRSACRSASAVGQKRCMPPRPAVMPCSASFLNSSPGSRWHYRCRPELCCDWDRTRTRRRCDGRTRRRDHRDS